MDAAVQTQTPQPKPPGKYNPNKLFFEESKNPFMLPEILKQVDPETYKKLYDTDGKAASSPDEPSTSGFFESRKKIRLDRRAIAAMAQMALEANPIELRLMLNNLGDEERALFLKYYNGYKYALSPKILAQRALRGSILGVGGVIGDTAGRIGKGVVAAGKGGKTLALAVHRRLMDPTKTTVVGGVYRSGKKKSSQLGNFIFGRLIGGITSQIKELVTQIRETIEAGIKTFRSSWVGVRIINSARALNNGLVKPAVGGGRGLINGVYKTARAVVGSLDSAATLARGAVKGGLAAAAIAIGTGSGILPALGAGAGITGLLGGATLGGAIIGGAVTGGALESFLNRSKLELNQYIAKGIKFNLYHQVMARLSGDQLGYMKQIVEKRTTMWSKFSNVLKETTEVGRNALLERTSKGLYIPRRVTFAKSLSRFLSWGAVGAIFAPFLPFAGLTGVGGMLLLGGGAAAMQLAGDTVTNRFMKQFANGKMGKLFGAIPLVGAIEVADAAIYKNILMRQSINGGIFSQVAQLFGFDPSDPRFASLRISDVEQTLFDIRNNPLGMALTYMNMVQYISVGATIRNFAAIYTVQRLIAPRLPNTALRLSIDIGNLGLIKGGPAMSFEILKGTVLAPFRLVRGLFNSPLLKIRNLLSALRGFPLIVAASVAGGTLGFSIGSFIALALGLPVGTFAAIGATLGGFIGGGAGLTLGTLAGGTIGRYLGGTAFSFLGPLGSLAGAAIGTFIGEAIGSIVGTLFGGVVDKVTQIPLPQINIVNPLTILQGAWNFVKFLTSPLRNLTDYADLAFMLVSMITFFAALSSLNGGASTITPGGFSQSVAEYLNNRPIIIAADEIDIADGGYSLNFNTSSSGDIYISGLEVKKSTSGYSLGNDFMTISITAAEVLEEGERITANSLRLRGRQVQMAANYDQIPTVFASSQDTASIDTKVNFCEILPSLSKLCYKD